MRILVLSNLFPPAVEGGYERECAGVVEHLRKRHDVTVLTASRDRGEIPREADVFRELPRLGGGRSGVVKAPLVSIRAARIVARHVEAIDPDLVYIWNGANLTAAATVAALRSAKPVVIRACEHWIHRLIEGDQFARYLAPSLGGTDAAWGYLARAVNHAPQLRLPGDRTFPVAISWVSEFLRRSTEVTAPLEVVESEVLYPALPQGELLARSPRKPADGVVIAIVGRIVPEKGVDVAIRALAALRDDHGLRARLVVAGPGGPLLVRDLKACASSLGVGGDVEFSGPLDTEGVADLLSRSQVVLVPSTWDEPAGLTVLEAAAARAPVVASRRGGIPELLAEGSQALLFEAGNAAECARMIATTLNDQAATDRRVGRAYERSRELSLDHYFARTDAFLERATEALTR